MGCFTSSGVNKTITVPELAGDAVRDAAMEETQSNSLGGCHSFEEREYEVLMVMSHRGYFSQ